MVELSVQERSIWLLDTDCAVRPDGAARLVVAARVEVDPIVSDVLARAAGSLPAAQAYFEAAFLDCAGGGGVDGEGGRIRRALA